QLPALLQHHQERVPAVRGALRGDPRRRAGGAAGRRGPPAGSARVQEDDRLPRLLLLRPLQRDLRRAAQRARPDRRPGAGDAPPQAVRHVLRGGRRTHVDRGGPGQARQPAAHPAGPRNEPRGDRRVVPVLHDHAVRRDQGEGARGQGPDARRDGDRRQGGDVAEEGIRFEGICQKPPDWYRGASVLDFRPRLFADQLGGMSRSAAAVMASQPRSAGGSGFDGGGGGGFSGGGFGGGGGGGF